MAETKRKSYTEYLEKTVKLCSHKWILMESRTFRDYKLDVYYNNKAQKPAGKLIKIVPNRCKSYSCPVCGKKKVLDLLDRLKGLNLNKYRCFHLTLKNNYTITDVENNLRAIPEYFNRLNKALRKKPEFKDLEYFRVVEIGKDGMVHIHGIWNKYVPSGMLSDLWRTITKNSYIVKVERIKNRDHAINYLFKYLTKNIVADHRNGEQTLFNMDNTHTAAIFYELGKRRYQSSRKFFHGVKKQKNDFVPYYTEKLNPNEIDKLVQYLIKEYKLTRDDFDFTLYSYSVFTEYLFNTS